VSENGGWCLKESQPNSPHHRFDIKFCQALATFLKSKSVASFGDGPGTYKKKIDELALVRKYDAFDGAPFVEKVSGEKASSSRSELLSLCLDMCLARWCICRR